MTFYKNEHNKTFRKQNLFNVRKTPARALRDTYPSDENHDVFTESKNENHNFKAMSWKTPKMIKNHNYMVFLCFIFEVIMDRVK